MLHKALRKSMQTRWSLLTSIIVLGLASLLASLAPAQGALAAPPPLRGPTGTIVPAGAAPDLRAYIMNGNKPVLIKSGKLTPSTTGFATEVGPTYQVPGCVTPPSSFDPATATPKQLALYHIPPQAQNESRAHWLAVHPRNTVYTCMAIPSNAVHYGAPAGSHQTGNSINDTLPSSTITHESASLEYDNSTWTGKVADQNCASQPGSHIWCNDESHNYTEIDSDYYLNCGTGDAPPLTQGGSDSEWLGIGGTDSSYELQQAGINDQWYGPGSGSSANLNQMFWEYVGPLGGGGIGEQYVPGLYGSTLDIPCGAHLYTKVWGGNCLDVQTISLPTNWGYENCYGPDFTQISAEAIVERDGVSSQGTVGMPVGASTTFYGVGITDNGSYIGMGTAQHDYENAILNGTYLATTGPIQNDPGDPPYDQYTVTVYTSCGGLSSCL